MRLRRVKAWVPAIVLGMISVTLVMITILWLRRPPLPPPPEPDDVVRYSTDTPDETAPNPVTYDWTGKPTDPKIIRLSRIGVTSFIQKVGADQNQQIAVPNNLHLAGWYVDSVRPGQKGLSVINGHVDGRDSAGVFFQLHLMQVGDSFQVELGNGTVLQYVVQAIQEVATADAAAVLFSQSPTVTSQLNLVTCSGTFDTASRSYDKRVIISASLDGSNP